MSLDGSSGNFPSQPNLAGPVSRAVADPHGVGFFPPSSKHCICPGLGSWQVVFIQGTKLLKGCVCVSPREKTNKQKSHNHWAWQPGLHRSFHTVRLLLVLWEWPALSGCFRPKGIDTQASYHPPNISPTPPPYSTLSLQLGNCLRQELCLRDRINLGARPPRGQ